MSKFNTSNYIKYRILYIGLFCSSLVAILAAYFAEFFLDLKPCELCIYERIPYFLILILTGYLSFLKKDKSKLLIIAYFLLICEVSLAIYHTAFEHQIFLESSVCNSDDSSDNLSEKEMLRYLQEKSPSCNMPVYFSFVPSISIAELNLAFCILILLSTLVFIKKIHDKHKKRT